MGKGAVTDRPIVYNTQDVQKVFGCSRTQAYRIMNAKVFPSFKIGHRLYVTDEDLRRFLSKCKDREFIF